MPTPPQSAAPAEHPIPGRRGPFLRTVLTLALPAAGTALLLFLAFPPADLGPLAFVAFVPLLLAVRRAATYRGALLCGAVAALAYLAAFAWVASVAVLGWLALAAYVGAYTVAAASAIRCFQRRFPVAWPLPAALLWTGLEFLRASVGPGFPWLFLGYTQYRFNALVQVACWGGVFGLSFVVFFVNAALAGVIAPPAAEARHPGCRWLMLLAAGTLLATCAGYGAVTRGRLTVEDGPVVGVVQQNFPRRVAEIFGEPKSEDEVYDAVDAEIRKAAELSLGLRADRPELIVWPETTVGVPLNVAPELFRRPRERETLMETLRLFRQIGDEVGSHVLVGAPCYFPRSAGYVETLLYGTDVTDFANSAVLYSPDAAFVDRYDKIRLVPFGEYVPFSNVLPFLQALTPLTRQLTPGPEEVVFSLPQADGEAVRFGALICYEDVFPALTRAFRRKGAEFLVNLTDEGWYWIPGELRQHLAMAVFRAIETRTTVVRAANTGISCFINPRGEVFAKLAPHAEGALSAPVQLCDARPPYVRWGDLFGAACLAASAVLGGLLLVRSRRKAD